MPGLVEGHGATAIHRIDTANRDAKEGSSLRCALDHWKRDAEQ